jgi:hypothetical protein
MVNYGKDRTPVHTDQTQDRRLSDTGQEAFHKISTVWPHIEELRARITSIIAVMLP